MANQPGNGRNDQNRWRSDDDAMHTRNREDEERMANDRMRDDERFMQRERERSGPTWDDRTAREWDHDQDRSVGWRSTDRGGMGQSGWGAGRERSDRAFQSRNPSYPPSWDDRARERGVDERFAVGRGMSGEPGGYLGNQRPWGNEMGHRGRDPNENMGYGGGGGMQGGGWQRHDQRMGYEHNQGQNMYDNTAYGPGYFDPHRTAPPYGYAYEQRRDMMYGRDQQRDWRPGDHEHHESLGQRIKDWFTGHRGKGPMGYQRSDERIRETVCEALSDDDRIDASSIEVAVKNGEVMLTGTVDDRRTKRMAEECVENLSGVKDVQNNIRVVATDRPIGTSPTTTPTGRHRA